MASDVFIGNLESSWNKDPKNPMVSSPLDHSYYPRHLHTNTGQIKASRGRCLFLKHGPRTKWFYLRIKKKEGDKRIYNPTEVYPRYSPLKIEVYKSLFNGSKCNFGQKLKMEKVRRIQIDAILFPFTFWSDLKKKASHTHSANALSLSYQQARVEEPS